MVQGKVPHPTFDLVKQRYSLCGVVIKYFNNCDEILEIN